MNWLVEVGIILAAFKYFFGWEVALFLAVCYCLFFGMRAIANNERKKKQLEADKNKLGVKKNGSKRSKE